MSGHPIAQKEPSVAQRSVGQGRACRTLQRGHVTRPQVTWAFAAVRDNQAVWSCTGKLKILIMRIGIFEMVPALWSGASPIEREHEPCIDDWIEFDQRRGSGLASTPLDRNGVTAPEWLEIDNRLCRVR
jgi:hypothetical protein